MNVAPAQRVTPQNALKLSMWLAATHPQAFKAVLDRTIPATAHRRRQALGTYIPRNRPAHGPAFARGRFGGMGGAPSMGAFGDDLPEVTVTAPQIDIADSAAPISSDPVLQEIAIDIPPSSFDLSTAAASVDNSGGFWSSIGSGLSSIGGGLASAVGAVAQSITSPAVLAAAGNVAATVIKANATNAQQQAQQQAILQSQFARTVGAGAHPVTYATDPRTGATVPMYYNSSTGQYSPSQPGFLSSILPAAGGGLSQYLPYILIGGGILLIAVMMRR